MNRKTCYALFASLLALGLCGEAGAQEAPARPDTQQATVVHLSVKGYRGPFPLAIKAFSCDGAPEAVADEIFACVAEDLRRAVHFEVLADSARADSTGWAPALTRWSAAGARAFLRGQVLAQSGRTELFATLYRLPDGRLLIAKSYPVHPENPWAAAHGLSDDIVYTLTGQSGVALTRIAFVSRRNGNREIHTMDYDGRNIRQVTGDRVTSLSPDWSPDGRQIVYSLLLRGKWELAIVDAAGGPRAPVPTPSAMNTAPAWSPDGKQILFSLNDEGNIDLYTVSVAGGRLRRLTDHSEADTEPAWSPDGRRIAFTSDRTGLPKVYVMNADGTDVRRLTWEPDAYEGSPCWSPDGRRIAFVRRGFEGFDIYVVEAEGGAPFRLTAGGSNENPAWSADGLHIAFSSTREGGHDIYAMKWDGTDLRRLTSDGDSILPAWSPFLPREARGR